MQPQVQTYSTRVHAAAPQAVGMARALGWLYGKAIRGDNGAIRYGYPALGDRSKFTGYANTPQLFIGYDPGKVAAGTFRGAPGALPSTSSPTTLLNNPLQRAMATVTNAQLSGQV